MPKIIRKQKASKTKSRLDEANSQRSKLFQDPLSDSQAQLDAANSQRRRGPGGASGVSEVAKWMQPPSRSLTIRESTDVELKMDELVGFLLRAPENSAKDRDIDKMTIEEVRERPWLEDQEEEKDWIEEAGKLAVELERLVKLEAVGSSCIRR